MKKIIGIAAASLMALSLFACDTKTTKTTRYIDNVPYSSTRVVRETDTTRYKAPRTLTPKNVRTYNRVDAPNLLPYTMNDYGYRYGNVYNNGAVRNAVNNGLNRGAVNYGATRNASTPYNVNN